MIVNTAFVEDRNSDDNDKNDFTIVNPASRTVLVSTTAVVAANEDGTTNDGNGDNCPKDVNENANINNTDEVEVTNSYLCAAVVPVNSNGPNANHKKIPGSRANSDNPIDDIVIDQVEDNYDSGDENANIYISDQSKTFMVTANTDIINLFGGYTGRKTNKGMHGNDGVRHNCDIW